MADEEPEGLRSASFVGVPNGAAMEVGGAGLAGEEDGAESGVTDDVETAGEKMEGGEHGDAAFMVMGGEDGVQSPGGRGEISEREGGSGGKPRSHGRGESGGPAFGELPPAKKARKDGTDRASGGGYSSEEQTVEQQLAAKDGEIARLGLAEEHARVLQAAGEESRAVLVDRLRLADEQIRALDARGGEARTALAARVEELEGEKEEQAKVL